MDDSSELLEGLKEFSKAIDNDVTLAANNDKKIASQKAVKTYVDAANVALQNRIAKLEKLQLIPGMIMAWKGSVDAIPSGWKLCQELKDKFLLGAGADFKVGTTGGERMHQLTVEGMPSHQRNPVSDLLQQHYVIGAGFKLEANQWSSHRTATTNSSSSTGGSQPHNNLPLS